MYCVIAVEPGIAPVVRDNLARRFPDWRFETVTDARELFALARTEPDAVVVSRFLPGEEPAEVLRRLPVEFPSSHIVLLVGALDERARAYLRQAAGYGLRNAVTGKLPGDRPYTVFAALEQAREEMPAVEGLEWEEEPEGANAGEPDVRARAAEDAEPLEQEERSEPDLRGRAFRPERGGDGLEPRWSRAESNRVARHGLSERGLPARGRGAWGFVLVAANKGGVGKTTVAAALSLALARGGVPVCLADFDFGGPSVAEFFDIRNRSGMERLAGARRPGRLARELLVEVEKNLAVLPGPMDKTIPALGPEETVEIVDELLRDYLVVGDTPPEFWAGKPWLEGLFERADLILAVVDQSKLSEAETRDYAPKMIMMGAEPGRIRIVLNRFNSRLHSARKVEAAFNAGFRIKKNLPRVAVSVPEDWENFVLQGYRGLVPGLEDRDSPWVRLAEVVARDLGLSYRPPAGGRPAGGGKGVLPGLLGRFAR